MPAAAAPELRDAVVRAYADHESVITIARRYGVSEQSVSKWANAAGYWRRRMCGPAQRERRARAERLWREGVRRAEIARTLGCSENTIAVWRFRGQWPSRREYGLRPIVPAERHTDRQRSRRHFSCPACGYPALERTGHPTCQRAA